MRRTADGRSNPRQGSKGGEARKDQSEAKDDRDDGEDESGDRRKAKHGHSSEPALADSHAALLPASWPWSAGSSAPGATRTSSARKSGDQNSSGKGSRLAARAPGPARAPTPAEAPDRAATPGRARIPTPAGVRVEHQLASSQGSNSPRRDADAGKLLEAQKAWLAAVKELHQARTAEKAARQSEAGDEGDPGFPQEDAAVGGPARGRVAHGGLLGRRPGQGRRRCARRSTWPNRRSPTSSRTGRWGSLGPRDAGLAYLNLGRRGDGGQGVRARPDAA